MTKPDPRSARRLTVCLLTLFLAACNTTPERPPPPPLPRAEPTPPPVAPAPAQADSEPQQTHSSTAAADAETTYAPPSANAAEVEFEEIPVDEHGKPMAPATTAAAAPAAARQDTVGDAASSGGAVSGSTPLARMNDTIAARERPDDGGAGAPAPPGQASDPDLVGPRMAVGALTTDEHIAAVDAELEAGLQAFDERLRRARAAAAAERARSAGAGGAAYGAEDGRGQRRERPPEGGTGGAAASGTGLGQTPDLSGTGGAAATPPVVGMAPSGLPDGRDDDIVARQLREAALSERDPVLQAKLWDEYRKYKAGQ